MSLLLPLIGMFIFGGKKEEEEGSVDQELRCIVAGIMSSPGEGLYHLLARASPDGDVEKIKKMLAHNVAYNAPGAIIEAKYWGIYVKTEDMHHEIIAAHYPILHAFLTLALACHTGSYSPIAAGTVGGILSAAYQTKADYSELKKRKERLARTIAREAKKRGITTDEEKTAKIMEEAFDKAFNIIDKIAPDYRRDNLVILERTISSETDDPSVVLRNAGIDIEPELEEFRQFLAEISGKKIEPKKPPGTAKSQTIPAEVLAIVMGLKFAGYSEEALKKAEEEIIHRLDALIEHNIEKNTLKIAYYFALLRLIQKRELEKIERIFIMGGEGR